MLTLRELAARCQKPHWQERGSFLARRFARPAALYVTWVVCRWPISANFATGFALIVGWAAALLLATPGTVYFALGVATLWLWYLLDHVDGQLARLRGSQSVTGVYFDFMMHHLVHTSVAFALGYGLARSSSDLRWTLAGAGFAFGLMALSLSNDCRYKAFHNWEKSDCGLGIGGCGLEESAIRNPKSEIARRLVRLLRVMHTMALRACEVPNIILVLSILTLGLVAHARVGQTVVAGYTLFMGLLAPALAVLRLARQVWNRQPDREFHETFGSDQSTPSEYSLQADRWSA